MANKRVKKKGRFYTTYIIEKSLRHHIIEWVATVISIIGALLNTNLLRVTAINAYDSSFYFYFVADLLWVSFALKHKHWGVFTTFVLYAIINLLKILTMLKIFPL